MPSRCPAGYPVPRVEVRHTEADGEHPGHLADDAADRRPAVLIDFADQFTEVALFEGALQGPHDGDDVRGGERVLDISEQVPGMPADEQLRGDAKRHRADPAEAQG